MDRGKDFMMRQERWYGTIKKEKSDAAARPEGLS
jgi:hypothetical protein